MASSYNCNKRSGRARLPLGLAVAVAVVLPLSVAVTSCIKDDIPYPHIQANVLSMDVQGQLRPCQVDSADLRVTAYLQEDVDPAKVRVQAYSLTPEARLVPEDALSGELDLTRPLEFTVSLYQDYRWTLVAVQDIERYFTLQGQIGASVIDPQARTVSAQIPESMPLEAVEVTSVKLGPRGSTMDPALAAGSRVDFTHPVEVTVTTPYGTSERWTITVTQTREMAVTVSVDAWTRVAWVYGEGQQDRVNGVEYRLALDQPGPWLKCPSEWVTTDGGAFRARISGLEPMTNYEARVFSGGDYGRAIAFTTGEDVQVPNISLSEWSQAGKLWNPWPQGGTPYWDTGNKGATTLGQSNSVPTEDTSSGTGLAAKLETRFVGIGSFGKLAAGNIFIGSYVRTDGTNGVLSFGREFAQRPTHLTGYFKYTGSTITDAQAPYQDMKGRPDSCIVWIALIDSQEPFEIRTKPSDRHLFDPDGSYVVAYGKMETSATTDQYAQFDIVLNYKSTSRVPRYLLITASASKYGDYFTGGRGSTLYLDDMQLRYD